jgi:hypothetical protein
MQIGDEPAPRVEAPRADRNGEELRQQQTDAVAVIAVQRLDAGVRQDGDCAGGDGIHAVEQDGRRPLAQHVLKMRVRLVGGGRIAIHD